MTLMMTTSRRLSILISMTTAQPRVLPTSPPYSTPIWKLLVTGLPTLMTRSLRPHQQHHRLLPHPRPRLHLLTSPVNAPSISPRLKIASQTPRTSTRLLPLKTARAMISAIRASMPPRTPLASVSTPGRHIVSPASYQIQSSSPESIRMIISSLHMGA